MSDASKKEGHVPGGKVARFRENRVTISPNLKSHAILKNFYGETLKVSVANLSQFGARLEVEASDLNLRKNELISEAAIYVGGEKVYEGAMKVVNERILPDKRLAFGVILDDDGIDFNKINAIMEMESGDSDLSLTKRTFDLSEMVDPKFKQLIADLNTVLQEVRVKLLNEEAKIRSSHTDQKYIESLFEHAISIAFSVYGPEITKVFSQFQNLATSYRGDEATIHKKYFRINFHPLILGSPFANRSFSKPLGYAGDFGLMVMLYEYKDLGGNLFEKFFHRFCCNQIVTLANKNRVEYLAKLLKERYEAAKALPLEKFHITTIACGPAREIQLFLSDLADDHGPQIAVTLIDNEALALDHARSRIRKIAGLRNIEINIFQEDAVLGIIKGKDFVKEINGSDVIVCAGLFDYLSDRVSTRLIEKIHGSLSKNGQLIIGNVSKANPDRFSMEYGLDWHLILRSKEDMLTLVAPEVQMQCKNIEVVAESLGINLFLRITKA